MMIVSSLHDFSVQDLETDELIQQTIRTEFKECTIFTIAHRLNTILDRFDTCLTVAPITCSHQWACSDRIMVLDQGQVVEFDEPTNLLSAPKSIFYGMAQAANLIPSSHSQSRANIAKAEDESDI
jgi:ABC-type multidrug transport system fused ATPase/permease subunit